MTTYLRRRPHNDYQSQLPCAGVGTGLRFISAIVLFLRIVIEDQSVGKGGWVSGERKNEMKTPLRRNGRVLMRSLLND